MGGDHARVGQQEGGCEAPASKLDCKLRKTALGWSPRASGRNPPSSWLQGRRLSERHTVCWRAVERASAALWGAGTAVADAQYRSQLIHGRTGPTCLVAPRRRRRYDRTLRPARCRFWHAPSAGQWLSFPVIGHNGHSALPAALCCAQGARRQDCRAATLRRRHSAPPSRASEAVALAFLLSWPLALATDR